MLDPAHLGVDLLEHARPLLQAKDNVLLDQRELDGGRQLLELLQLPVRLGQERLLVLLAAQGEESAFLVVLGEHFPRDGGFSVREHGDAPLVLVQAVALGFEVEDRPRGDGLVMAWRVEGGIGRGCSLVLCRHAARGIAHRCIRVVGGLQTGGIGGGGGGGFVVLMMERSLPAASYRGPAGRRHRC